MMKVCLTIAISLAALFCARPASSQGVVSLDHVDGLDGDGKLAAGRLASFHLRLTLTGEGLGGSTNGFHVYSPDGAIWAPLAIDSVALGWEAMYDGGFYFARRSVTGSGADTVGFGGYSVHLSGMTSGFDSVAATISTTVGRDQIGKTLCLDSCYYPPSGFWLWAPKSGGHYAPDWDGPHCWTIAGCCEGSRGNINGDPGEEQDISDLVYLVEYMFAGGPEPPCFDEANVDGVGEGTLDISDLVFLVEFMFVSGPAPGPCPQ